MHMRIISIDTMLEQLEGLLDTYDLNDWERDFVADLCFRDCDVVSQNVWLTERQVEKIKEIYRKNFCDWRY